MNSLVPVGSKNISLLAFPSLEYTESCAYKYKCSKPLNEIKHLSEILQDTTGVEIRARSSFGGRLCPACCHSLQVCLSSEREHSRCETSTFICRNLNVRPILRLHCSCLSAHLLFIPVILFIVLFFFIFYFPHTVKVIRTVAQNGVLVLLLLFLLPLAQFVQTADVELFVIVVIFVLFCLLFLVLVLLFLSVRRMTCGNRTFRSVEASSKSMETESRSLHMVLMAVVMQLWRSSSRNFLISTSIGTSSASVSMSTYSG